MDFFSSANAVSPIADRDPHDLFVVHSVKNTFPSSSSRSPRSPRPVLDSPLTAPLPLPLPSAEHPLRERNILAVAAPPPFTPFLPPRAPLSLFPSSSSSSASTSSSAFASASTTASTIASTSRTPSGSLRPLAHFPPILPAALPDLLLKQSALLIDIRPPSQHRALRLLSSLPLSVPSTLLKRPSFSLPQISALFSSPDDTARFNLWPSAPAIIILDTDSSFLPDGSNITALLAKFKASSFPGQLTWIKGGISRIVREADSNPGLASLLTSSPIPQSDLLPTPSAFPLARDLPLSAFQQASTTFASHNNTTNAPQSALGSPSTRRAALASTNTRVAAANPFFDNIRQLTELHHGNTEHLPLNLSPTLRRRLASLPLKWLSDIALRDETAQAERIASQFHLIELLEQKRLLGIMREHSRQTSCTPGKDSSDSPTSFPFSIAAGVEMGSKNRYRNIWPFEHCRVRLWRSDDADNDYMNASFIRPPGTNRCYIATQGPLPDTFADFWSMLWQQNASVIVMLTKRFEGSSTKCGTYWPTSQQVEARYGDFLVTLLSSSPSATESDADLPSINSPPGFNFGNTISGSSSECDPIARRTFKVANLREPRSSPRHISHYQYLGWPDLDVPEDPGSFLNFQAEVGAAMRSSLGPLILHCSAGVGRTGGYILIDAVLDAFRHSWGHRSSMPSMPLATTVQADSPDSSRPHHMRASSDSYTSSSLSSSEDSSSSNLKGPVLNRSRKRIWKDMSDAMEKSPETGGRGPWQSFPYNLPPPSPPSASSLQSLSTSVITPFTSFSISPAIVETSSSSSRKPSSPPAVDHPYDVITLPSTPTNLRGLTGSGELLLMDEPVRVVLESMREQRMSLCQTLRQYVFAYRVIIEGVISIVDSTSPPSTPDVAPFLWRPSAKRRQRK